MLAALLAGMLLVSGTNAVGADDTVRVAPHETRVESAEVFTIALSIGNDLRAVKSFHFLLRYDSTVVHLDSVAASTEWLEQYPATSSPWPITVEVVDSLGDDTSIVFEIFNVFLDPALLYIDGPASLAELYMSGAAEGQSAITFEYSLIADTSAPYPRQIDHTAEDGLVVVGQPCVPPGDITGDGGVDVSDLSRLVSYLFLDGPGPVTGLAAANYSCDSSGVVDISDLTRLVNYLFVTFEPLCNPCEK